MARGKKPSDPNLERAIDHLSYIPLLEAYGQPDTVIERDAQFWCLTPLDFAWIAEGAVEQHAGSLRQGTVSGFRHRARSLKEQILVEMSYHAGINDTLTYLVENRFLTLKKSCEARGLLQDGQTDLRRQAAAQAAMILNDIKENIRGKRGVGRPKKARNPGDFRVLQLAAEFAGDAHDRRTITSKIPPVVRLLTELGQLPSLGATKQDNVDQHAKRIRKLYDGLPKTPPARGPLIIRKGEREKSKLEEPPF